MELKIDNVVISEPVENILRQVRAETGFRLYKNIKHTANSLMVTCPFHKNGQENRPSCSVMNNKEDSSVPIGWHYCFTCGISMSLEAVVGRCFGKDTEFGKDWLKDRYGEYIEEDELTILPALDLNYEKPITKMDESILNKYDYYHNYMWERKLSKEVVDKFHVGYDPQRKMITFPTYDEQGNLVMITGRSVISKQFHIDPGVIKPVYLMDYVIKMKFLVVIVTEAQIDALTSWSYGFPCVATIGNMSDHQMSVFNSCGVRAFITMFDNDDTGRALTDKFNRFIRRDVLVYNIKFDDSVKDINDMSKDQFFALLHKYGITYKLNSSLDKLENF